MMIKPGVNITGIRPEMVLAVTLAQPIFAAHGESLVITSALDGKHMRNSLHYAGQAVDFRLRNIKPEHWEDITNQLRQVLGKQFDVVLSTSPPHIHIEFQPEGDW